MCGICGTLYSGLSPYSKEEMFSLSEKIKHRGPDDATYHEEAGVKFAHRRLSIIDIKGGKQPVFNENKDIICIYNGELYNFRELRKELIEKGHVFSSYSDSEVLVHLYEEEGINFLKRLRGMFALAIWDRRKKLGILARDRMGIKPLYYVDKPKSLVFCSELKPLSSLKEVSKEISPVALELFLTHDAVPAPFTMLDEVKKLPAGHSLIFQEGEKKLIQFASALPSSLPEKSGEEIEFELEPTFRDALRRHLISDVPVGVFLSGGLDSSLLAVLCAEANPQLKTFSIGFSEDSFDESKFARQVARHIGSKHTEINLSSTRALDLLESSESIYDEPLGDPALLAMSILSMEASKHVKVVLSGEGSDELFYGYPTYRAHKYAPLYRAFPKVFREGLIEPFINSLPASPKNFSLDFILKRFISGAGYDMPERHLRWMAPLQLDKFELFSREFYPNEQNPYFLGKQVFENFPKGLSEISKAAALDLVFYLQDGILMRTDKASMAHSLEVRVPFLDNEIINFAQKLSPATNLKLAGGKSLLKRFATRLLPSEVVNRKKKGFGLPIAQWLNNELRDLISDKLSKEKIKKDNIFQIGAVERLLREHSLGQVNHRKALWALLIFQIWKEKL